MNQRIQELAEQARASVPPGLVVSEWIEVYNHKLGELIVAECLEACSRANEIRHLVPPTQEQVVLSCMREIETTFRS
jgi:hypothetical protein